MPVMIKRMAVVLLIIGVGLLPAVVVASALNDASGDGERTYRDGGDWERDEGLGAADVLLTHTNRYTSYLPIFARSYLTPPYDMLDFLRSSGDRIFEVQHSGGSQARHQTQTAGALFFHTKGNEISAEWEELWADNGFIYRGTDTSPGNGQYYTLRDPGEYGSKWAPRFWNVGDIFERSPQVTFYDKRTCMPAQGGVQRSYLKFEAFHGTYTFESGITLENVVQLAWLLTPNGQPIERYYYAASYGLVGWWSNSGAHSYISEDHDPGTRPDNLREEISCLDRSPLAPPQFSGAILQEWPGEHRR